MALRHVLCGLWVRDLPMRCYARDWGDGVRSRRSRMHITGCEHPVSPMLARTINVRRVTPPTYNGTGPRVSLV